MGACWRDVPEVVTLPDRAVHVWRASLSVTPARLSALEATLAEDERARADGFHSRLHREHFVVGRGALRAILAHYAGVPAGGLLFAYGRHGKPMIATEMNRGDVRFNLSHSGGLALYAVTRGRELGVDLEEIAGRHEEEGLAVRFFSPREVAALGSLPPERRREAFYACWTRKEAYVKAKGDGLSLPLDRFDVAFRPGEPPALLSVSDDPLEAGRWSLEALDVAPGYAAALCFEGRATSITCVGWP
jgi:4'-phosphopantetheinyl transferase